VLALALAIVAYAALAASPLGDEGVAAVATVLTGVLIVALALLMWRGLPAHERRLALARKHSRGGAVGQGVNIGIGLVIGALAVIAAATLVDDGLRERIEDVEADLGSAWWQVLLVVIALVVLAPLGEELLFRGLLLRGLVRRVRFWPAAVLSGLVFAAAHADVYTLWPRAITLAATGVVLAWLYRWRGFLASVTAHATVNAVAAVALILGA
jgi:hypothetical protein